MKRGVCFTVLMLIAMLINAQSLDSLQNIYQNSAEKLLSTNGRLIIGGYGEVHYNQPLNSKIRKNGDLDEHRIVMLFGYKFNKRTQFITEIEFEHVKEVYIEQAFLQYKINDFINFRGGLLLIPMGIINEYHEPTTFNGVERPLIDKTISPTTWREIGFGLTGNIYPMSIKYQAYIVNGFNSYDGDAHINGKDGFREGRQKGANSYISSPCFTGKIQYYGIRGLNLGLSGYYGKTQSTLYDGIDKNDKIILASADSSVIGVYMVGFDVRYSIKGFQFRGQYYYTNLSNTSGYNNYTADNSTLNDVGSSMVGYYIEAGYNIFRTFNNMEIELIPFLRYEAFNTHNTVEKNIIKNGDYNNSIITTGLTLKLVSGAVLKAGIQFSKSEVMSKYSKIFNAGFGIMF